MRMVFLNLPVRDLPAIRAFWTELGFSFDEQFSDDTAACLRIEENAFAMLITHDRFRDFITGEIADPAAGTGLLTCLSCADRAEVDALLARALDAGAKPWKPVMEQGPMYGASFQDPEGHVWELMSMDVPQP